MSAVLIGATTLVVPGGPFCSPAIASGSYSRGPSSSVALSATLVTVMTSSAPMAATVSSMYWLMPVPRPFVIVRVKAPTKIARIVRIVRVLLRKVLATAEPMRSRVFTLHAPLPRLPRPRRR